MFYVTCVEGKRTALIGGPFASHVFALASVDAYRRKCVEDYPFTWFAAFGTARIDAVKNTRYGPNFPMDK